MQGQGQGQGQGLTFQGQGLILPRPRPRPRPRPLNLALRPRPRPRPNITDNQHYITGQVKIKLSQGSLWSRRDQVEPPRNCSRIAYVSQRYGSLTCLETASQVSPSIFDTSLTSLLMWNLQSYPSTVLDERMCHFRGLKHTLTPPTYFQGTPTPGSTPLLFANNSVVF